MKVLFHTWLAQGERLTVFQRSVRERFQEGGSILSVVVVLALIVLTLVAAYWLSRRINRQSTRGAKLGEWGLFESVMARLNLGRRDRRILVSAARSSRLEHPTVLLLSRSMFDLHVRPPRLRRVETAASRSEGESSHDSLPESAVSELRARLFAS